MSKVEEKRFRISDCGFPISAFFFAKDFRSIQKIQLMKKFIRDYVEFNVWANERICAAVSALTDEQLNQQMKSSFPTIRETLLHIWDAQDIWMERFDGRSPTAWPPEKFNGTAEELTSGLINSSKALLKKVKGYNKKELKEKVSYTTLKGNSGISPVFEMFAHVVNHGTYHRGQLVTMMRDVGVIEIPATDLIAFFRDKANSK